MFLCPLLRDFTDRCLAGNGHPQGTALFSLSNIFRKFERNAREGSPQVFQRSSCPIAPLDHGQNLPLGTLTRLSRRVGGGLTCEGQIAKLSVLGTPFGIWDRTPSSASVCLARAPIASAKEDEAGVSAVEQAGAILRAVATQQGPVTFGDIVRLTSLPKSSVHNVVRRLVEIGLLDSPGKNQYRIGWELVALASARLNDNDVVREFTRACEELPQLPDEGLVLSILDGSDMLYIATRATSRPFGIQYRIGMRLPAACTASGKAVLATRSDSEIRMMFKGQRSLALNPLVRKTISDLLIDVGENAKARLCNGRRGDRTRYGLHWCCPQQLR